MVKDIDLHGAHTGQVLGIQCRLRERRGCLFVYVVFLAPPLPHFLICLTQETREKQQSEKNKEAASSVVLAFK